MKKSFEHLLNTLEKTAAGAPSGDNGGCIEVLPPDELLAVRGGDKEYKPIYDAPAKVWWQKPTMLFDFIR